MSPRIGALLVLLACEPTGDSTSPHHHVIPQGLVHVAFAGEDTAPRERLALRDALAVRAATELAYRTTNRDSGHRRWFFHAFDRHFLEFQVARWQPRDLGGTYVVERRIFVRRDRRASDALAVTDRIAEYEQGAGDLRAGMTPEEVTRRRGPPEHVQQLGPFGAFDFVYADRCIRFLDGRAAHLWPRTSCIGPS